MQQKKRKILFLVQYPENVSPGQRFRVELYKDLLLKNGFESVTRPFLNEKGYAVIYKKGFYLTKLVSVLSGYARRFGLLLSLHQYSYIFLQREVSPFGPPFFVWTAAKVFNKKIIYDFDDAIWIRQPSEKNKLVHLLKNAGKVPMICQWAYKVSCGNEFLCSYAKKYNGNVVYNPTCVDAENFHNQPANHDVQRITVGWTGSFSTLKYLYQMQPVLHKLQQRYDFDIRVICNEAPVIDLKNVTYVPWSPASEVPGLSACQIGLMPLTDDEWSEGKCGFKLIQYLSLEIPAVASPVGVNKKIIENGTNGFLCSTDDEWYVAIEKLMQDAGMRKRMGAAGRKKIVAEYSLQSNAENFLSLFS